MTEDEECEDVPDFIDTVDTRAVSRGVERDSRRQPLELEELELLRVHEEEDRLLFCEQLACAACTCPACICAACASAGSGVQDRCGIIEYAVKPADDTPISTNAT